MAVIEITYVVGAGLWGTAYGAALAALAPIVLGVATLIVRTNTKVVEDAPSDLEDLGYLFLFSMVCSMAVAASVAVFQSSPTFIAIVVAVVLVVLLFFVVTFLDDHSPTVEIKFAMVVPAAVAVSLFLDYMRIPFFFGIPLAPVIYLIMAGLQFCMIWDDYHRYSKNTDV